MKLCWEEEERTVAQRIGISLLVAGLADEIAKEKKGFPAAGLLRLYRYGKKIYQSYINQK